MKNSFLSKHLTRVGGAACTVLLISTALTGCKDDLLTGTPSWLGESIYEELESRGNFTQTLSLIRAQEEDMVSVLSKTGSATLFAADDAAWERFYQNNAWGVKSIDEMTVAQKRLLFNSNYVKSAYLIELLGNIPSSSADDDPKEGTCLRRESRVSEFNLDSVPVMYASEYPDVNPIRLTSEGEQVDYWKRVRGKESIKILKDATVPTMVHFMPKFMQLNNITDNDVRVLTNGEITTNSGAFVNGQPVVEADITCQNGYVQVLGGVPEPRTNMAEIIATNPQFSIYSRLLERFSYPYFDENANRKYNQKYGTTDSVYVKRYFNNQSNHALTETQKDDGDLKATSLLPFDPGWNQYSTNTGTYQTDAAVMLVPTNEAFIHYLQNDGKDIYNTFAQGSDYETALDKAPDATILPLLTNTMKSSLKTSVPSMFPSMMNNANEPMNIYEGDIDQVIWGCNGLIYQTNKVFLAPEYVSVYYPCVIRATQDLSIVYSYVSQDDAAKNNKDLSAYSEGFYAYLNNMGMNKEEGTGYYSFIIPTDNALQYYHDPVSRYRKNSEGASSIAYKFNVKKEGYIGAKAYRVDWENLDEKGRGTITETVYAPAPEAKNAVQGDVVQHFRDIMNSSLATSLFTPGQQFYSAINGGPVIVEWDGNTITGVAGSFQYEKGYFIPVTEIVDKSEQGNGTCLIVDEEPMMSTSLSPYAALTNLYGDEFEENPFANFAALLNDSVISNNDGNGKCTVDKAFKGFGNNNSYTIYVPTNESIQTLTDSHQLPTLNDIVAIQNCLDAYQDGKVTLSAQEVSILDNGIKEMIEIITNFINYHIQDNAIYVHGKKYGKTAFETALLDQKSNRFRNLTVSYDGETSMTVVDGRGVSHSVDTSDKSKHNVLTRQYYFDSSALSSSKNINSSAYAVIHQIDSPLLPSNDFLYSLEAYNRVMDIVEAHPINEPTDTKRRTR